MFSKAELSFLRGETNVSSSYERVLIHRIRGKLQNFMGIMPLLAQNEKTKSLVDDLLSVTKDCSTVTRFRNDKTRHNTSEEARIEPLLSVNAFFGKKGLGGPGGNRTHDRHLVRVAS